MHIRRLVPHVTGPGPVRHTVGRRLMAVQADRLQVNLLTVIYGVVDLLGVAAVDERAHRRLVVLLGMIGVLLALGCALGIAWRFEYPHIPEFPVPTIMCCPGATAPRGPSGISRAALVFVPGVCRSISPRPSSTRP